MSQTVSSSNAAKKKLDEKNSKIIRELAALPDNRFCFECGQRGPTYVNITEGSFCCSTCSGLLRGLNPPHRVKSISMATFTNDELEKIRSLGNSVNAVTWMGRFNGSPPKFSNREDTLSFLVKKYEKKSWFVSREEREQQERLMTAAKERSSQGASSVASDASSQQQVMDLFFADPFTQPYTASGSDFNRSPQPPFSPPAHMAPPPPMTFPPASPSSQYLNGKKGLPVDPFSPMHTAKKPVAAHTDNDPFASFDAEFGTLRLGATQHNLPAPSIQRSQTVEPTLTTNNPFAPMQTMPSSQSYSIPTLAKQEPVGDKYSALAELDQILHAPSMGTMGTNNTTTPRAPMTTNVIPSNNWSMPPTKPSNGYGPKETNPFERPVAAPMPNQYSKQWTNPFATQPVAPASFNAPVTTADPFSFGGGNMSAAPRPGYQQFPNPFTSIPKSCTLGSISDCATSAAYSNPFASNAGAYSNGGAFTSTGNISHSNPPYYGNGAHAVQPTNPFGKNQGGDSFRSTLTPADWNPFN